MRQIAGGANAFTGESEWVRFDVGAGTEIDPAEKVRIETAAQ
jgi:hypothetical protein